MNPPFVPQVKIFETFAATAAAVTQPMRACIVGPNAQLVRFNVPSERNNGSLGEYDPQLTVTHPWPNLLSSDILDLDYTKLWVCNPKLVFFSDVIGDGQVVTAVAGKTNQVSIAGSYGFRTNAYAARLPGLYGRDVTYGDRVRVSATISSVSYVLDSYVIGFTGVTVAAVTSPSTTDGANAATQVASHTSLQTAGIENSNDVDVDLTSYNGLVDGAINETYTFTVIQASTSNDLTTALLRMVSASGLDNVSSFAPAAVTVAKTVGSRGLKVKVTATGPPADLLVGQTWQVEVVQAFAVTATTSGGTYIGGADDTYIVTVIRGGLLADSNPAKVPQWLVTTANGLDASGPTTITAADIAIPIGNNGVTLKVATGTTALCKGDRFYVAVTAATTGRVNTLLLADSMPTQLQTAPDLNLFLFAEPATAAVTQQKQGSDPLLNWTAANEGITVNSNITLWVAGFTDNNGNPLQLPMLGGTLFVEYRAWISELSAVVGAITDPSTLQTSIPGAIDADNPLSFGVSKALANSNGTPVKYIAVADPNSTASWNAALNQIIGRMDVYNIVPLTYDPAILTLVQSFVDSESAPEKGRRRGMFCGIKPEVSRQVVGQQTSLDGNPVLATLAADTTVSSTAYKMLAIASGNAMLLTAGVRTGDTVRFFYTSSFGEMTYQSFTIAAVISQTTLKLSTSASAAVGLPSLVEIWHNQTTEEQITDLQNQAATFNDNRVCAVWSDLFGRGPVPNVEMYFVAAAVAGERSGSPPHQSLSSVSISGFDGYVAATGFLNGDQVGELCANGVWVVTRTTAVQNNAIINRLGTTTNSATFEAREEMVRYNTDSMCGYIQSVLTPYLTGTNMVASALGVIRVQLVAAHSFLQVSGRTDRLGGQLVDYTIVSIARHETLLDTLVINVDWVVPGPINEIDFYADIVIGTGATVTSPVAG